MSNDNKSMEYGPQGFDFKHATPKALQDAYNAIAARSGDDRFLTRRELKRLPDLLMDHEQVLSFASGLMEGQSWLIVLTDQRILFLNKRLFFGLIQSSIPLVRVNAISGNTGILFGTIGIQDGASTRVVRNVMKRCVSSFVRDANEALAARG